MRGRIVAGLALGAGLLSFFFLLNPSAPSSTPRASGSAPVRRFLDRRCRGGCENWPGASPVTPSIPGTVTWILQTPLDAGSWAQGLALTASNGSAVTDTRASTRYCNTGASFDIAQLLLNPEALDQSPWALGNTTVALPVVSANALAARDGTMTAEQIVFPAVSSAGTDSILYQENASVPTTGNYVASIYLYGVSGGSSTWLSIHNATAATYADTACTVTAATWVRCVTPSIAATAGQDLYVTLGTDRRDATQTATVAITVGASEAKFEQASSATAYVVDMGQNAKIVRQLANNKLCVESNGIQIEGGATNTETSSEAPQAWSVFGAASPLNNTVIAPNGAKNGGTVTVPASSNTGIFQNIAASAATQYTASAWLWVNSGTFSMAMSRNNSATWTGGATTGALTLNTTPTRYTLTFTTAGGDTVNEIVFGTSSVPGSLVSVAAGSFNVWGVQLETGPAATSYIPTTNIAVARAADNVGYTSPLTSTTWCMGATLEAIEGPASVSSGMLMSQGIQFSVTNAAVLSFFKTSEVDFNIFDSIGTQMIAGSTSVNSTPPVREVGCWDNPSMTGNLYVNGPLVKTTSFATNQTSVPDAGYLGSNHAVDSFLNGWLDKICLGTDHGVCN